jgi:methylated-DNA-protein-cysteine methyltransferase related protein
MGLFEDVYKVVKTIPAGKVMTYGQVAAAVGTRDARRVGQALHANKDRNVPCHRVVFADGRLAPGYAFGGAEEQKKKLLAEGVEFDTAGKKVKQLI